MLSHGLRLDTPSQSKHGAANALSPDGDWKDFDQVTAPKCKDDLVLRRARSSCSPVPIARRHRQSHELAAHHHARPCHDTNAEQREKTLDRTKSFGMVHAII